jgi:cytochrome c
MKASQMMRLIPVMLLAIFATTATLSPAAATPVAPAFAPCAACHKVEKGKNGLGPSLWHVVGRARGAVPGFNYSDALKAKGGVWSEAELDAYLTNPRAAIPGTRMSFPGYRDAAKRAAVIAYLKSVK